MKGDSIYKGATAVFAFSILFILAVMLSGMVKESLPALGHNGWRFITGREWDPVQENFGALPYLYGSVISSLLALLVATPLSIGTALFITEILPPRIGNVVSTLIELLAAIPSVIYGLWGLWIVSPCLSITPNHSLMYRYDFIHFF